MFKVIPLRSLLYTFAKDNKGPFKEQVDGYISEDEQSVRFLNYCKKNNSSITSFNTDNAFRLCPPPRTPPIQYELWTQIKRFRSS